MGSMSIADDYRKQHFPNAYDLADGIALHQENGDRFQIPHPVLKKHLKADQFVELRIDSSRFSVHPDAPEKCECPSCHGEASNPILRHEQPNSLFSLPPQDVPSRGWGEDFWVQIVERDGDAFRGIVDNRLYESRLHELNIGDVLYFESRHVLAVHPSHRQELVMEMDEVEIRELVNWLGQQ